MENLQLQNPNRNRNRLFRAAGMVGLVLMGFTVSGCATSREVTERFTIGVECPSGAEAVVTGSTQDRRRPIADISMTCLDTEDRPAAPRAVTLLPEGSTRVAAEGAGRELSTLHIDVTTSETDDPLFGKTRWRPEASWDVAPEDLPDGAIIRLDGVLDVDRVSIDRGA